MKHRIAAAVLALGLLASSSVAYAQHPRAEQRHPAPPGLPAEVLNGPYNGPSTPATAARARQLTDAHSPRNAPAGHRPRPSAEETALLSNQYNPRNAPIKNPRRLGTDPTWTFADGALTIHPAELRAAIAQGTATLDEANAVLAKVTDKRISAADLATLDAPDEQTIELQVPEGACLLYSYGGYYLDWSADEFWIWGYGYQTCGIIASEIAYMSLSEHLYKCVYGAAWYCLYPQYWTFLQPACQQGSGQNWQVCAPPAWAAYTTGWYQVRTYGYAQLWDGAAGGNYRDSAPFGVGV